MLNGPKPEKLALILPPLYATEDVPTSEKEIKAHFFVGGFDWWLCEYDPEQDLAFGFVNLNDPHNSEWGYVSIAELRELQVPLRVNGVRCGFVGVEYDEHWTVKKASEIEGIKVW